MTPFDNAQHDAFMARWPLASLQAMTLTQYTDVDNTDTFCYWVEYGTNDLGSISGYPANKFGIFRRKPGSAVPVSSDFGYDEEYTWRWKYGKDRHEAFARVKELVVAVVEAAQANDMDAIGSIDLVKLYMWKLAHLYAPERVVPIFQRTTLELAARELGLGKTRNVSYAQLHRHILDNLPSGTDPTLYARAAYRRLADQAPRYYVIGSSYDVNTSGGTKKIFPRMVERDAVAIGFFENEDLTELYDASEGELDAFIDSHFPPGTKGKRAASTALHNFMSIRAGDRIAVKNYSDRNTASTKIIGYAVAIERNGSVYRHDPNGLGQLINVEFLDTFIDKMVPHFYPHTLHELEAGSEKWESLFGTVDIILRAPPGPVGERLTLEGTTDRKNSDDYDRKGSIAVRVKRNHNRIQQSLYDELFSIHGDKARMEVGGQVDILLDEGDTLTLYEVKPYPTATSCVRHALGQLIEYAYHYGKGRSLKLRVVGPAALTEDEQAFLEHVRKSVTVDLDYLFHVPAVL